MPDPSRSIDTSADTASWCRVRRVGIDGLGSRGRGELEAADRRDVADRLVLTLGVVPADPRIQLGLGLLEAREPPVGEQFLADRLVEWTDSL
jgi:hypothetical protein